MSPRVLVIVLALVSVGCRGCHDEHPYVPYAIGAKVEDARAPGPTAQPVTPESGVSGTALEAVVAPRPGVAQWSVGGLSLLSPDGLVFVSAVVRDFDGDGAPDAFALVRAADGKGAGSVAYYRGTLGAASGVAIAAANTFPAPDLARDASCTPVDHLAGVGTRDVFVELGERCTSNVARAPTRWLAVLSGAASGRVQLAATFIDPPSGVFAFGAEVADRDGDGRDDVALRVTLSHAADADSSPAFVELVWLDRTAGWSRDEGPTHAGFSALAAQAMTRANNAKQAPGVPESVTKMRELWRALCADGGSPRLLGIEGIGPVTCGISKALEDAGIAEVRAFAKSGDPLEAALALDIAERSPATHTPARVNEARAWVEALAAPALAREIRAVSAVPQSGKGHEPSWGPLAFEPSGKLLVRTDAGVVRVDPTAGDEAAAPDVLPWPAFVLSPDGALHWIETYDACDGFLYATFASGDDMRDVRLWVPPPLGDRCVGSRGAPVPAIPVSWKDKELQVIVEGRFVSMDPQMTTATNAPALQATSAVRGGPLSPDGKTLVVPTSIGLVVRAPSTSRLYRSPEIDAVWTEQHDCTVSNDAAHVACVRRGHAWVGTWDVP